MSDLARWPERLVFDRMGGVYCRSALSPDGRTLATARHRPDLDRDLGSASGTWPADGASRRSTTASSWTCWLSRRTAAARARNCSLAVWDVDSGSLLGWSQAAAGCVAPLAFSPDGSALAIQAHGSKLNVLDPVDGRVRATFNYLQADAIAFSHDGRRLAVAANEEVTVWDVDSHQQVSRFDRHVRPRAMENLRQELDHHVRAVNQKTGAQPPHLGREHNLLGYVLPREPARCIMRWGMAPRGSGTPPRTGAISVRPPGDSAILAILDGLDRAAAWSLIALRGWRATRSGSPESIVKMPIAEMSAQRCPGERPA